MVGKYCRAKRTRAGHVKTAIKMKQKTDNDNGSGSAV